MYPRVLRTVLNVSTKLKNQKVYKNASLTLPTVTLIVQKLLPCTSYHCIERHYSNEEIIYIKDPMERKNHIDERAQAQIDAMIAEKPETEKLIKILDLEINVMRQDGELVPSKLRPRDWYDLLLLPTIQKRKKFLHYLFVIEKQQNKQKQLQQENYIKLEQAREERKNEVDNGEIRYGIGHNSMFRRITESTMNQLWTWNSLKAMMYGNKLVFDCSYESYMHPQEVKSCAKQLMEAYALNRVHNLPFEIFLCNADLSGQLVERLVRFIPNLFEDDFPITVTSKSYLELFEKSSLVYLTANAPTILEKYDPHSVYIIGAYVDKGSKRPVSLGKAKKENLHMAKLPLDKYLHFGDGSGKDLTLNQVCGIMLDSQLGDWEKALSHVPRRKLYEARMYSLERKIQREIFHRTKASQQSQDEKYNKEDEQQQTRSKFESSEVHDYSHAARAKLREQWNK